MVIKCRFFNCNETSLNRALKFFLFRKHDFNDWILACKNDCIKKLTHQTLLRRCYICSLHFNNQDYERKLSPFNNKLNRRAIPSDYKIAQHKVEEKYSASLFRATNIIRNDDIHCEDYKCKIMQSNMMKQSPLENEQATVDKLQSISEINRKIETIDKGLNVATLSNDHLQKTLNDKVLEISDKSALSDADNSANCVLNNIDSTNLLDNSSSPSLILHSHTSKIEMKAPNTFLSDTNHPSLKELVSNNNNIEHKNPINKTKSNSSSYIYAYEPIDSSLEGQNGKNPLPNSHNTSQYSCNDITSFCCAIDCDNSNLDCVLFPFPKRRPLAAHWLRLCGRSQLVRLLKTTGSVPSNLLICEEHFHIDWLGPMNENGKRKWVLASSFPSIFSYPGTNAEEVSPLPKPLVNWSPKRNRKKLTLRIKNEPYKVVESCFKDQPKVVLQKFHYLDLTRGFLKRNNITTFNGIRLYRQLQLLSRRSKKLPKGFRGSSNVKKRSTSNKLCNSPLGHVTKETLKMIDKFTPKEVDRIMRYSDTYCGEIYDDNYIKKLTRTIENLDSDLKIMEAELYLVHSDMERIHQQMNKKGYQKTLRTKLALHYLKMKLPSPLYSYFAGHVGGMGPSATWSGENIALAMTALICDPENARTLQRLLDLPDETFLRRNRNRLIPRRSASSTDDMFLRYYEALSRDARSDQQLDPPGGTQLKSGPAAHTQTEDRTLTRSRSGSCRSASSSRMSKRRKV